jgi:hypothetical protein
MQAGINISNSWKTTKAIYTNINTTWKSCKNIYINVSGTWKPIWSYSWKTGNWGNCTQTCGGGTQSRSVYCYRADGFTVNDSLCSGTKPNSSQICNTHSCQECRYNVTTNADNYGTCYDTNITVTNAWWTIRGEGFYPYSVAGIYWDGADQGVSLDYNATSATANGYYYTRSTAKESCGNMNTSIPGSTQYTYHNFYDVCRTPV